METIRRRVERIAGANVPLLIQGENGTGKEVLARYIHGQCPWQEGPFVKINCPAIPATLLESELFGYEQGAFTGALASKPGRIELAHLGTLFLDEIGELDPSLQAKLLHLLQDGQFSRIGAREDKRVDVRVICATNQDLERDIEAGRFRQDLFYRINVVCLRLPPLHERLEDIVPLAHYFLRFYNEHYGCEARPLSYQTLQLIRSYDWPGNIRQLENLIKRYVILGSEEAIAGELMAPSRSMPSMDIPLDGTMSLKEVSRRAARELEHSIILRALREQHWNRKRAAQILKISYRALLYKLKEAGVPSRRERVEG